MKTARAALLAVLFGVALTEVAVRLIGPRLLGGMPLVPFDMAEPIVAGRNADPTSSYLVFDADLGWTIGADRASRNGLYHSDALGFRRSGARVEEPLAAAFGDSFTHGDDVGDDETWIARLNARGTGVINAGVPAYGVDQAWLRYRRVKATIAPPVVLIGVMADNIARHLNRYRPFITPAERVYFVKPRFELNEGRLELIPSPFRSAADYSRPPEELTAQLRKVGERDRFFQSRYYEASSSDALHLLRVARTLSVDPAANRDWRRLYADSGAVDLTLALVEGFAKEVVDDGRIPLIVFLPERSVSEDVAAGRVPPTASLVSRLSKTGYSVIDLTQPVADFVRTSGSAAAFRPHYSKELSDAVAAYVQKWMNAPKSLP